MTAVFANVDREPARANAVREWLVKRGIPIKKLTSRGFGFKKPIAPNDTDEGRQKNRRIEAKEL